MSKFILFLFFLPQFICLSLASERPNIVVILCDDLGYGDLECYGHPHIKTPHLNQMAKEGIRFTDFYSAAPVCSPSRVGLLTGRSPNRAGVYDWISPRGARAQVHMRAHEITIAQILKKAGYATIVSGKWHCNGKFNSKEQPQPGDFGFDHWFATQNNASPSHANPKNFVRNGKAVGQLEGYSCQLVTDEVVKWLDEHMGKKKHQPFFAFLSFHEPHEPVASPADIVDTYKSVAKTIKQAEYYANVDNIDKAVGKFLAALKKHKIDDNTLVIFTSDNGPETLNRYGPASSRSYGIPGKLKGMKLWTSEAGFRVAGIMRWPGKIKAEQTSKEVVSALDFFPTFSKLAKAEIPANLKLDGIDFLPALEGKTVKREKPLLWAYYQAINEHRVAMRDGDWKILASVGFKRFNFTEDNKAQLKDSKLLKFELYKIAEDPSEKNELKAKHPEKFNEMKAKLEKHYKELVDDSYVWPSK